MNAILSSERCKATIVEGGPHKRFCLIGRNALV